MPLWYLPLPNDADGYAALIRSGMTAAEAFDTIVERTRTAEVRAGIRCLLASPEGCQVLTNLQEGWAAVGLPAPWDTTLELTSARSSTE